MKKMLVAGFAAAAFCFAPVAQADDAPPTREVDDPIVVTGVADGPGVHTVRARTRPDTAAADLRRSFVRNIRRSVRRAPF